jgi:hypothetical protein
MWSSRSTTDARARIFSRTQNGGMPIPSTPRKRIPAVSGAGCEYRTSLARFFVFPLGLTGGFGILAGYRKSAAR